MDPPVPSSSPQSPKLLLRRRQSDKTAFRLPIKGAVARAVYADKSILAPFRSEGYDVNLNKDSVILESVPTTEAGHVKQLVTERLGQLQKNSQKREIAGNVAVLLRGQLQGKLRALEKRFRTGMFCSAKGAILCSLDPGNYDPFFQEVLELCSSIKENMLELKDSKEVTPVKEKEKPAEKTHRPRKGHRRKVSESPPASLSSSPESGKLKSAEEREVERTRVNLPILRSREEFLEMLLVDKVVVVTAETGSGKTTQLPQYAAEAFDGLIICTQPRVIAAISIADRISQEFDGVKAGVNVGYKVGSGQAKEGKRIMLMTDAALVQMAQRDPLLKNVSVLIIDEAHERSLNTDLVVGISKLILEKRPNDFHVVIASATIDPKPFLDFFLSPQNPESQPAAKSLSVPGRKFKVDVTNKDLEPSDVLGSRLIDEVMATLKEHPEGNCLVFLPGAADIDRAIKRFRFEAPKEWVSLPLYGGLPPEEQARVMNFDDEKGSRRMIVFCTNVAETSLTVPNTRLVIDSGLAKEARFDPKRRLTLLEQVYISRSSADQRKGRAGRTAEGHCIRLYSEAKLVRQSISPEILRSSLDKVVLTLCCLGHDPLKFPLMDRPKEELLNVSLRLLQKLGCLSTERPMAVSDRGRLFNNLPFDPRLSNFVITAHEQYGSTEIAAEIAAILVAPGSIMFLGGASKAQGDQNKRKIALAASEHQSDLLFLRSTFRKWLDAGRTIDRKCSKCGKPTKPSGCRSCRVKYALDNSLNNKILEIVQNNVQQVSRDIPKLHRAKPDCDLSEEEIVGRCLAVSFEEQVGELMMRNNPDAGVFLLESRIKGIISSTSSLAQKGFSPANEDEKMDQFVVAMSITKLPSGLIVLDQLHRIRFEWLLDDAQQQAHKARLSMVLCYRRVNVSAFYQKYLQDHFSSLSKDGHDYASFVICAHDNSVNTLSVYCPQNVQRQVSASCTALVDEQVRQDIEYECVAGIGDGVATVTLVGGLMTEHLNDVGQEFRVRMNNPPVASDEELKTWLQVAVGVKPADVKWLKFNPGNSDAPSFGTIVFRNEKAAKMAVEFSAKKEADVFVTSSEIWGRAVLWERKHGNPIEPAEFAQKLECKLVAAKVRFVQASEYQLVIKNIRVQVLAELRELLRAKKDFKIGESQGLALVAFSFDNPESRAAAESALKSSELMQHFNHQYTTKYGKNKEKQLQPEISSQEKPGFTTFFLNFISSDEAEKFYSAAKAQGEKVRGEAHVNVKHADLLKDVLPSLKESVCRRFAVKCQEPKNVKKQIHERVLVFQESSPKSCANAAHMLASSTAPLKIPFKERPQKMLLKFINQKGLFKEWMAELGVLIEFGKPGFGSLVNRIVVFGPQFQQGVLMAKIGDQADEFKNRYKLISVRSEIAFSFRKHRVGETKLRELEKEFGPSVSLSFVPFDSVIEVVIWPDVAQPNPVMKDIESKISHLLTEFGSSHRPSSVMCVFCQQQTYRRFAICGHSYCPECLRSVVVRRSAEGKLPIDCLRCNTVVSIKDIRKAFDSEVDFRKVALNSVKAFTKDNKNSSFLVCAVEDCCGLLQRSAGYSSCPRCGVLQCPLCGAQADPIHAGRDCQQYRRTLREAKRFQFKDVIEQGKQFVEANWASGQRFRLEENPGLRRGCPAMLRYFEALQRLGGVQQLQNAFFAWHGTSPGAIAPICHNGFDPGRRSGQAYGPGEYFGMSSEVSRGYCGSGNKMLVAQLLRVPEMSAHGNFCYVVNNPLDWSSSYCVPLLVVTFGQDAGPTAFIETDPVRLPLFGFHLDEDSKLDEEEDNDGSDKAEHVVIRWDRTPMLERFSYHSPFRWSWKKDDGQFELYNDAINSLIETHFALYQSNNGPNHFVTHPITRYIDDVPQTYRIDFVQHIQVNTSTHYSRSIRREKAEVASAQNSRWEVMTSSLTWRPFEDVVQSLIEKSFRIYVDNRGPGSVQLQFPGRPETYSLNFVSGTQTNLSSGKIRAIRRAKTEERQTEQVVIQMPRLDDLSTFVKDSNISDLKKQLTDAVQRAAGDSISWTPPQLEVDLEKRVIVLNVIGVASTIAGPLVGMIQTNLYRTVGKSSKFLELRGTEVAQTLGTPRILQLLSPAPVSPGLSRNEATQFLAHTLIWSAHCSIFGDFIRDWVINGEEANEINVIPLKPGEEEVNRIQEVLRVATASTSIKLDQSHEKGNAFYFSYSGSWGGHPIEIVMQSPDSSRPDTDVANLLINAKGGLAKFAAQAGGDLLPLVKCIRHCKKKRFVFLRKIGQDEEHCAHIILKYLSRGWTCLSPLPVSLTSKESFSPYEHLLKPKQKFSAMWQANSL